MSEKSQEVKATPYVGFARKWRPQDFDDLAGQDQVGKGLRAEVEKGRIGHAYLFSGPRGVGKTSSARILAKAINCLQGPTPTPCGTCEHCRSITNGSNMDVIEIDGASNNSVDQVRDLRESINHVPFSCRYKIYIIDEVHMLSIQAFNALLKTLEEPPSFVIFIFATTEPEKIPDTIRSRCQIFRFRAITLEDIVARLDYILTQEMVEVDAAERQQILETIALAAEGGMRDAQVALDQVVSLSQGALRLQDVRDFLGVADQNALFHMMEHLRDRNTTALIEIVRDMVDRGRDLERYVKQVMAFVRDLLILRCGGSDELVRLSAEGAKRARELVASLDMTLLVNTMNTFLDLEAKMKQGTTPRFLLEFAFVRLTALEDVTAISDLIQRLESGGGEGGATSGSHAPKAAAPAKAVNNPSTRSAPVAETAAPMADGIKSIPLAGGGALEAVPAQDVADLRNLLMKAINEQDFTLARSLNAAPFSHIENGVAYFGVGRKIDSYDLKRLEKPQSKEAIIGILKRLTGADNITVRFGSETRFISSQPHPVQVVPREEMGNGPKAAESVEASKEDAAPPTADSGYDEPPPMMPADDYESGDAPVEDYEVSIEDARRALGKKGLSGARIRSLLQENPVLREKVELVQKVFGGKILDGENKPVRM